MLYTGYSRDVIQRVDDKRGVKRKVDEDLEIIDLDDFGGEHSSDGMEAQHTSNVEEVSRVQPPRKAVRSVPDSKRQRQRPNTPEDTSDDEDCQIVARPPRAGQRATVGSSGVQSSGDRQRPVVVPDDVDEAVEAHCIKCAGTGKDALNNSPCYPCAGTGKIRQVGQTVTLPGGHLGVTALVTCSTCKGTGEKAIEVHTPGYHVVKKAFEKYQQAKSVGGAGYQPKSYGNGNGYSSARGRYGARTGWQPRTSQRSYQSPYGQQQQW